MPGGLRPYDKRRGDAMKRAFLLLWILFVLFAKLRFPPEAETQKAWSAFLGVDDAAVETLAKNSLIWES